MSELADSPAPRLEAAFRAVAIRMEGLPACNPALTVEAVGFRPWQGLWLGVLVTPWTVNLMLLPGGEQLRRLGADERQRWRFPSGEYDFLGGCDPAIGVFQACSLFSPPAEFASQDDARIVARAALDALCEAADNAGERREAARLEGRPAAQQAHEPLSRRGFLTGGLSSTVR